MITKAETAMNQAQQTVAYYLREGANEIAYSMDVIHGSPEHLKLCAALLPAFIDGCVRDFEVAMRSK